jgi:hypothetical protein
MIPQLEQDDQFEDEYTCQQDEHPALRDETLLGVECRCQILIPLLLMAHCSLTTAEPVYTMPHPFTKRQDTVTSYSSGNRSLAGYTQPTAIIAPRVFRVGARVTF